MEVRKSLLENAGYGVFATRDYKKDELITTYDGYEHLEYEELHNGDELSQKYDMDQDLYIILTHQDYIYEYDDKCVYGFKKVYLDKHKECGLGSLINDRFRVSEYTEDAFKKYINDASTIPDMYNCIIKNREVYAVRNIKEGEELYTPYGVQFWMKKLNDDRYIENYKYCRCSNGKTFDEYVENNFKNFSLRESLNYTPEMLN